MMRSAFSKAAAPRVCAARRGRASSLTVATSRVDKCDKKSIIVSPSILSANFAKLGEQARALVRDSSLSRLIPAPPGPPAR